MKATKLILVILSQVALMACAHAISADKCRTNDWFGVGREWGFKGEPADKILKDQQACQKKGVDIAISEYKKGWEMGIGQYCHPDNAYKLGFAKKRPSKNCPIEHKPTFDQFYSWGKDASGIEKDIKKSESKLKSKKRELDKTEKKVNQLQSDVKKLEKETAAMKEKVAGIESEMASKRLKYKSTIQTNPEAKDFKSKK